LDDEDEDNDN